MIGVPGNVRVYLACGATDMRRGFDGLAAQVQTMLQLDPHGGAVFAFRGRRGDLVKLLWWDGQGLCLFAKRLERGRFVWPWHAPIMFFSRDSRRVLSLENYLADPVTDPHFSLSPPDVVEFTTTGLPLGETAPVRRSLRLGTLDPRKP